jgi:hypothetical protein
MGVCVDGIDIDEPVLVNRVRLTHRVSLRAKYLPVTNCRGSRISVSRADGGRDPMRLVVSWDHSLNIDENYAQAFREYVARQNWGGSWVIGSTTDGYVAVCDDPQWGRDV